MPSCDKPRPGLETIFILAIFSFLCVFLLSNTVEIPIEIHWKSNLAVRNNTLTLGNNTLATGNTTNASKANENTAAPTVPTTSPKFSSTARVTTENDDIHTDAFDTCVLKVYDPFYKGIKKVVQYIDPLAGCNKNFTAPTQLINGNVSIHPLRAKEFDKCLASCLEYVSSVRTRPSAWRVFSKNASLEMNCDFVWTRCYANDEKMDEFVHMQIREKKEKSINPYSNSTEKPKPTHFRPNVYVIVIDSVASTQSLRSLPKTMDFLKRNMSGVVFHHLNKVGDNSAPNAYAMTLGWRIWEANRMAIGAPNLPPLYDSKTVCRKPRDNDPTIFNEYKKAGYKTAWAEDWKWGDIYSYECAGTHSQHTTHTIRPFVAVTSNEQSLTKNYNSGNCFEIARDVMNYTALFMRAYKDSCCNRSSEKHEFRFFTCNEDFFEANEPHLRNSFVFFMGDHGMRFGSYTDTELGKREVSNPFFTVMVPEFLRKNEQFMETLEENSMNLATQYDVHATLIDILKFAPQSNFTNFNFTTIFENNPNNATSLIRPLGPFGRRNCKNIPVPFQFCLCEYNKEEINSTTFHTEAHKFLVEHINNLLEKRNVTQLCSELAPDKVLSMKAFIPEEVYRLYEIVFTTKPGGGEFKAHLQYDAKTKLFKLQGQIERLNAFGKTGDCVKRVVGIVNFCYCKSDNKG